MATSDEILARIHADIAASNTDEQKQILQGLHATFMERMKGPHGIPAIDDFQTSVIERLDNLDAKLTSIQRTLDQITRNPRSLLGTP